MNAERTFVIACACVVATLVSCSPAARVPMAKDVGLDPYGSIIRIYGYPKGTNRVQGELISVDFSGLYVLEEKSGKAIRIERSLVKHYSIFPAKSKSYAGFIPLSLAFSISHGAFGLITLPINLITSSSVVAAGSTQFSYTEEEVDYYKLYMFSRFPQGLPQGIDLSKLKGRPTEEP